MALNLDFKIGADLKQFRTAMGSIDHSLKNLSGGFGALGGAIGASFAVDAIRQFVSESVQLAAQTEGVRNAFEQINDPTLLDDLRKATKGTINDFELMKAAVKAKNFNIPLEQLGSLMGFAQKRATETGESIDYMAESIVLGIARKSIPILDNLGFSATEVREEFKATGDMATAVGNIIQRQMGDSADATLILSEEIAQQQAQITNLKTEIGEQLAPVYKSWISTTKDGLNSLSLLLDDQMKGAERLAYALSFTQGAAGQAYRLSLKVQRDVRKEMELKRKEEESGNQTTEETTESVVELTQKQKDAALKTAMLAHDIAYLNEQMQASLFTQKQYSDGWQAIEDSVDGVSEEMEYLASVGANEELEEFIALTNEFDATNFEANLAAINKRREEMQQGMQMMGSVLQSTFQQAFRPLEDGEKRMQVFVGAFEQMLRQMVVQLLATAAAAALVAIALSIAFGGAGKAGAMAFKGFEGGFGNLFGSTFDLMGGGFGFNGNGMGGQNGGGTMLFSRISGADILLSSERASNNRTRQRGF